MDTEGGGEAGTFHSQSRHTKGHMTNNYLTYSEEEALVDFVKDRGDFYNEINEQWTRPGRIACRRGLQEAATCQLRCARLGLNPKHSLWKSHSPSLARQPRK